MKKIIVFIIADILMACEVQTPPPSPVYCNENEIQCGEFSCCGENQLCNINGSTDQTQWSCADVVCDSNSQVCGRGCIAAGDDCCQNDNLGVPVASGTYCKSPLSCAVCGSTELGCDKSGLKCQ